MQEPKPVHPRQTMEQMAQSMIEGLGPAVPTELINLPDGEPGLRIVLPEGGTHVRLSAPDAEGRTTLSGSARMENGMVTILDSKSVRVEVVVGPMGGRIAFSHNESKTTDVVTLAATPTDVRDRVQQAKADPDHGGLHRSTTQLMGVTAASHSAIEEIESGLRNGFVGENRLGRSESLADRLAEDNELVVSAGFTHAQLAEPLSFISEQWINGMRRREEIIEYNGATYRVEGAVARMLERSAISGEERTSIVMRVVNTETNAALQFDALSPTEIRDHGFYGGTGEGVARRVSPGAIATVFNLQPQNV